MLSVFVTACVTCIKSNRSLFTQWSSSLHHYFMLHFTLFIHKNIFCKRQYCKKKVHFYHIFCLNSTCKYTSTHMNECCNYQYEHQNKFLPHRPKGKKVFSGLHMAPMLTRIKTWFSLRLCLAACLALKFPALGSYLSKMRFRADWCAFQNKSMFDEPWAERRKRGLFTPRVFNAITVHTFKWRLICKSSNLCESGL